MKGYCYHNNLLWCWILALIIGVPVLCGGYIPYHAWNESAITTTCTTTGDVSSGHFGDGQPAFITLSITRVKGEFCGAMVYGGPYLTYQKALAHLTKQKQNGVCYYAQTEICSPLWNLKDTQGTFIAGTIFTIIGVALLVMWFVLMIRSNSKRENYEEI